MEISRGVTHDIVQGLSEFCHSEELQDFTVTVGETNFGCHKLLLAACSGFFRGLFRSGMKEIILNSVTLEEISSEIFQWILEAIYTGRGILTCDNVIDIWKAAHQLQIKFIVTECEMLARNSLSLENYIQYSYYGRLLSSKIVTEAVCNFSLQKCDSFFKSSIFLDLPFGEVLKLITNQDLATKSEDEVLKAVLKWVEYTPNKELSNGRNCLQVAKDNIHTIGSDIKRNKIDMDSNSENISDICSTTMCLSSNAADITTCIACDDSVLCEKAVPLAENEPTNETRIYGGTPTETDNRKQYLFDLLSSTRTCLASDGCLEMLLSHPLVSETKQVREVINRAILYQLQIGKRNGQWSSMATHRNNSQCENVAITFNTDSKLMAYSFSSNKWSECKAESLYLDYDTIIQIVTIDKSFYCLCVDYDGDEDDECPLFVYHLIDSNKFIWSEKKGPLILLNTTFSVVAVNEFIYIVQRNKVWKLNLAQETSVSLCDLPENEPICHLTYYDQKIIAFYSVSTEVDNGETGVLCFDISNNTWTRLNNLEGPADGMTSFKDDHSTYLLQPNGDMWKLVKPLSDIVDFELVAKLWHCYWSLLGAVTFLDELYIYGVDSESITADPMRLKSVDGLFKKIVFLQSSEFGSIRTIVVPFTVDKKLIKDK